MCPLWNEVCLEQKIVDQGEQNKVVQIDLINLCDFNFFILYKAFQYVLMDEEDN